MSDDKSDNDITNPNMELWNSVYKTDIQYTKNYKGKGGFLGTAITAQYQVKCATEKFGMYGAEDAWGVKNQKFEIVKFSDDPHDSVLYYTAELYYFYKGKKGIIHIDSSIDLFSKIYDKWVSGNELYKKVKTDAMTKGLSLLGFNADIFMNDFSNNKHLDGEHTDDPPPPNNRKKKTDNGKGNPPPPDDDTTEWMPEEVYADLMKGKDIEKIKMSIASYSVGDRGIKAEKRKLLLGRIGYLEQEASKKGDK